MKEERVQSKVSRQQRVFTPAEMNRVGDALAYVDPALVRAVCDDSEMTDDGYIAALTPEQITTLAVRCLPTGETPAR